MLNKRTLFSCLVGVLVLVMNLALPTAQAASAVDVNYQVNQPGTQSASIANDYFIKPAKVTTENGKHTIEITLKNSSWITKFEPPGGAKTIHEDRAADTKTVQFTVSDLTKPVTLKMKVDVQDINYHHEYSVDAIFDKLPGEQPTSGTGTVTGGNTGTTTTPPAGPAPTNKDSVKPSTQEPNPQTSDSTPYWIVLVLLGSGWALWRQFKKQEVKEF